MSWRTSTGSVKRVSDKAEFYKLSQSLVFGNRLRQWPLREFLLSPPEPMPPLVSFRTLRVGSRRGQRYRVPGDRAVRYARRLIETGFEPSELLADESAPDAYVSFQAEIMLGGVDLEIQPKGRLRGIYTPSTVMRYATNSGVGMRDAYPIMENVQGIRAVELARKYLDAPSLDKLNEILAEYRDSVVELSAYPFGVGLLGWNTLFWEVRNY